MENNTKGKSRRIFIITAVLLAAISTVGWMRFQQALRHWYYLLELGIWPHPIYLAASGGLIGVAYAFGLIFHFLKRKLNKVYLRVIGLVLIAWLWIDRIFIGIRESFGLLLAGTIFISLCLVGFDLFFFQRNAYMKESSEHAAEN